MYSGNGKVFKKGNQECTLVGLAASTAGIPMQLMLDCRIRYFSKDAGKPTRKCHPGGHPTSSIQGFFRNACNFSLLEPRPAKFTYLDSPSSFLSL